MYEAFSSAAIVVALLGGPLALVLAYLHRADGVAAARLSARSIGVSAGAAVVLVIGALIGREATIPGFEADAFRSMVLLLVTGMGATVLSYAARSLRHEPYQAAFARAGSALVAAGAVFALTVDLLAFAAGWVGVGLAAVALIGTGPAQGRAIRVARARTAMAVSNLTMVIAVAILVVASGGTSIDGIGEAGGGALTAAGLLAVLAAVARGATMPMHRWLTDSLGAPTPSSALLHAGVVNGGAIALITLAPASSGRLAPALLAVVVGTVSCVLAEAVMLTRPDVKGRLAWSTTAQMSFTLVLCGLGLHVAAALHLVAHGLYKGNLFLGSGNGVRVLVRGRSGPRASMAGGGRAWALPLVLGAAAVTSAAVIEVRGVPWSADLAVPVLLAAVAAAVGGRVVIERMERPAHRVLGLVAVVTALAGFVGATISLKGRVAPDLELGANALSPWLVVPVLIALVLVAAADARSPQPGSPLDRAWAGVRRLGRPSAKPLFVVGPLGSATPAPSAPPVPAPLPRG